MGGLVGHNLFNSSSTFLDSIWLGSLSLIIFIMFQYFVFSEIFGLINTSSMTTTNTKDKSINKSPSSKKTDKKVDKKTDAAKNTESKESQKNVPKDNLKEQEDFLHLLDQEIDESADISKEYLEDLSNNLVVKLEEFGIEGKVEEVFIGGIMQHIEEAGVHSGDSSCVIPPYEVSDAVKKEIETITAKLALELKVVGLINLQFAVKDDKVYVLEVNPRSSRTVPFVSKYSNVPLANIAAQISVGKRSFMVPSTNAGSNTSNSVVYITIATRSRASPLARAFAPASPRVAGFPSNARMYCAAVTPLHSGML